MGESLDPLCEMSAALPTLNLSELPHVADLARLLGAVDQVRGWSTLATYTNAADTVAADLLDGEPFGCAVVDYVERHGQWHGTVGDLLSVLPVPESRPGHWPKGTPTGGKPTQASRPRLPQAGEQLRRHPTRQRS